MTHVVQIPQLQKHNFAAQNNPFFDCIGGNRPIGSSPQDGPPKKQRYCRRTRGSRVRHQLPFSIISFQITAWGSYGACACREPAGAPGEPEQPEAEAPGTPDAEEECRPLDEVIGDFDYPSKGEEVEDVVSQAQDEAHIPAWEDPGAHPEVYDPAAPTTGTAAERKKAYQDSWTVHQPEDVKIPRPPLRDQPSATRGAARDLAPDAPAKDFFELYWPKGLRDECMLQRSWVYAAARGANSTDFFQRYKPMGSHTLDHCFAVLIRNGLNPVPDIARDLLCRPHSFVFGDDRVGCLFDDTIVEH